MAINDLINGKLRVFGLGLILSCSGASDEGTAGCKNDSECKGDRYCIDGECVEGSGGGKDSYTAEDTVPLSCHYDSDCKGNQACLGAVCVDSCDADNYNNSCDGLVLNYCDYQTETVKLMDCPAEGFSHCGYAPFLKQSICFGEGKLGDECSPEIFNEDIYGDDWAVKLKQVLSSECDYNEVDMCVGYCTVFCGEDSDCLPEYDLCHTKKGYNYCTSNGP